MSRNTLRIVIYKFIYLQPGKNNPVVTLHVMDLDNINSTKELEPPTDLSE